MQKALELNGKKLMGLALKLDKTRSKEDSQESKKGSVSYSFRFERKSKQR